MDSWSSQMPEKARRRAVLAGEAGRAWLDQLDALIPELERRWTMKVRDVRTRATEAFVANVRCEDGTEAIVKLVIPGIDVARNEVRVLGAAQGKGYAGLLRADADLNAMLLEKLGPQLFDLGLPEERQLEIICTTLAKAWMNAPPDGTALPTGAGKAREFAQVIESKWRALAQPCTERACTTALAYAQRRARAHDTAQPVVAHGDAHQWNTLAEPGSTRAFKLIDPDGAFAERAYDLSVPMREWPGGLPSDRVAAGRHRCTLLARFANVDPAPIWEWALIQCVWNGLLLKELGVEEAAAIEFAMADAWADAGEW